MKAIHILFASCILLISSIHALSQCYELIWSEEFDSTGFPNPENWSFQTYGGGGNNELQYYRADSSNAWVEDGTLVITARKETYSGWNYTSARINTQDKFEFQYGRIEARMKLPYGQGIWPAFWMLGDNYPEVGWPACGEIDIMEMVGGQGRENTVHSTLHWDNNGSYAGYGLAYSLPAGIFADTFHLFSTEWTPTAIKSYVDGIHFFTIDITSDGLSEFHQPFYMILNLAVGGNWPGSPDASTVFPQRMEVDYVRVYKDTEAMVPDGPAVVGQKSPGLIYSLPSFDSISYSWSVPSDAEIVDGQGSPIISVNWGCLDGEVSCQLTGTCDTYQASIPVTVGNQIHGPVFIDEGEEDVLFYVEQMSETTYEWNVPEDAEITLGGGTDSILVNWGSIFTEVTLSTNNSCGENNYTYQSYLTGQYPYPDLLTPHAIPGSINATDYDIGGEGVAYHDLTIGNEGDGPRQDERVDTEYNDFNTANVGYIRNGEWLEYTIKVDSSWMYALSLRVATAMASGGPFSILVNDEVRMGPIAVPGTGAWDKFTTFRPGNLPLYDTDSIMRIQFDKGDFNLGRMTFLPASTTSVMTREISTLTLFPNPVIEFLIIKHSTQGFSYQIIDLVGNIVFEGLSSRNQEETDVSQLQPGSYIVITYSSSGISGTGRFIKLP